MKLSAPIYHLKRQAKLLSRREKIPLHLALDRIAAAEGLANWSALAARLAASSPAQQLARRLRPGDMLLVGARPGHGKTLFGLELAVSAMEADDRAAFFTLEDTMSDMLDRFRAIGAEPTRFEGLFQFDCSDEISAGHIIATLKDAPRGTLAVIDYLQILDQRRDKPELGTQIRMLKAFAQARGVIFVFISQIDRSYDPVSKPVPDLADVRLPNPLDLALFNKACFLNDGEVRFQEAA
jgi:replicative DNA helicase